MHPLQVAAEAQKLVEFFPGWSAPDDDDGYSQFQAPLSINGITEAGLFLGGGTYLRYPDRHVTLEVTILTNGGYRRLKLMRVDWRSLRGSHTNQPRYQCPAECGRRVPATHFHAFDINWREVEGKLRGPKLPCAKTIPDDLQTFEILREYVGKHFRINNIDIVKCPEWEYKFDL